MSRQFIKLIVLLAGLCIATAGHAIPINFSIQGSVDAAAGMNPFGLSAGESVSASATFDDSLIASGNVSLGTDGNAFGSSLTFNIGSLSFVESDDQDYAFDIFPTLSFVNGVFTGFDFVGDIFESEDLSFSGFNAGIENLTGTWNADSVSITPVTSVPEPSSMMLLGLGVLGMFRAARKTST